MHKTTILSIILGILLLTSASGQQQKTVNHWKLKVFLKSGVAIEGIVVHRRFVEYLKNGVYYNVTNPPYPVNCGIRLWYVNHNKGFVYVLFKEMVDIEKMMPLSDEQLAQLRDEIEEKVALAKAQPKEFKKPSDEDENKTKISESEKDVVADLVGQENIQKALQQARGKLPENYRNLLDQYPPEEGWGTEKYEKFKPRIARNKAQGNPYLNISKHIVNFSYVYDEWQQAFSMWEAEVSKILDQKINLEEFIQRQDK